MWRWEFQDISQDTQPLLKYREEELEKPRGDGAWEHREWNWNRDCACYNDLDTSKAPKLHPPIPSGPTRPFSCRNIMDVFFFLGKQQKAMFLCLLSSYIFWTDRILMHSKGREVLAVCSLPTDVWGAGGSCSRREHLTTSSWGPSPRTHSWRWITTQLMAVLRSSLLFDAWSSGLSGPPKKHSRGLENDSWRSRGSSWRRMTMAEGRIGQKKWKCSTLYPSSKRGLTAKRIHK